VSAADGFRRLRPCHAAFAWVRTWPWRLRLRLCRGLLVPCDGAIVTALNRCRSLCARITLFGGAGPRGAGHRSLSRVSLLPTSALISAPIYSERFGRHQSDLAINLERRIAVDRPVWVWALASIGYRATLTLIWPDSRPALRAA